VFAQAARTRTRLHVGVEPGETRRFGRVRYAKIRHCAPWPTSKAEKSASRKGSSAHFLLVRAVESAGLQWTDIQPIYLTPADARAAFERGSVDAWVISDPFYAATELAIAPRVLATGRGLSSNNSFHLASKAFAAQHAQAIALLFEELTAADRFVQERRPEAIKLIADFSGLDAGVVNLFCSAAHARPWAHSRQPPRLSSSVLPTHSTSWD